MAVSKLNMIFKNKGESGAIPLNKESLNKITSKIDEIIGFASGNIVTKAGENLDNYKDSGIFFFDVLYAPVGIPAGSNGWLQVMKGVGNFVKQIWYRAGTANSNDYETYVRTYTKSWSSWKKFEIVEDSGWKDLTFNGGISVGSIAKKAQYRKIGNVVQVRGDVSGIATANTIIATLPTEYRPSIQLYNINACSGNRYCRVIFKTNGEISLEWTSDGSYDLPWYSINFTFIV